VDRQFGHPEIPLQTSVLAIDSPCLLTAPSKAAAQAEPDAKGEVPKSGAFVFLMMADSA
jgi:hypothetical protein